MYPSGPDSLTWQTLGDLRLLLVGMRAGLLQTMHPAIEKGVRDHSDYFAGPFNRILRSVPQIAGVVYDEDRLATATKVRDYHRPIAGRLDDGRRYHALDPETYYWAHATFFEAQVAAMELFGRALGEAAKERLYQESVQWYSLYGVSLRPVPEDYHAFRAYWERTCDEVLEHNRFSRGTFTAASRGLRAAARPVAPRTGVARGVRPALPRRRVAGAGHPAPAAPRTDGPAVERPRRASAPGGRASSSATHSAGCRGGGGWRPRCGRRTGARAARGSTLSAAA